MFTLSKTKFYFFSFVVLFAFVSFFFYNYLTDDFRISNIIYEMPHREDWEINASDQEQQNLNLILSQRFFYMGKGAQSYVFGSEDGKYVIKFFKFKHLQPSLFSQMLFLPSWKKKAEKKQRRLLSVFNGHRLAWETHRPESGLVYIQLNPTKVSRKFKVIDKIGLERTIDLGEVAFVVQERAKTFHSVLTNLLEEGNIPAALSKINQMIDLYLSEYQKGVYDRDHAVLHNTGFVAERPIHLDIGMLTRDESLKQPIRYCTDLLLVLNKIERWIDKNYPEYYQELIPQIEKRMSQISKTQFKFHIS